MVRELLEKLNACDLEAEVLAVTSEEDFRIVTTTHDAAGQVLLVLEETS